MTTLEQRLQAIKSNFTLVEDQSLPNFLIIGESGIGKTTCLSTAQFPLLLNSFDPGGSKVLSQQIAEGKVFVRDYSRLKKGAYNEWYKDFIQDEQSGLLNEIKTYVIDSATTFAGAMMEEIIIRQSRKSLSPELSATPAVQDYGVALATIKHLIKVLSSYNCSFVLLAHSKLDKDEETGATFIEPNLSGQLKIELPLIFDEVYYLIAQGLKNERKFITGLYGKYKARTRIGANNKLQAFEDPNIVNILKKTGYIVEGTVNK